MNKNPIRFLALLLVLALAFTLLAGCGQSPTATQAPTGATTPTEPPAQNYWDLLDTVADTSDLPDWTGPKLKLVIWDAQGTGNKPRPDIQDPIVAAEIERVTGVSIDYENSYDNRGQDESILELIAASGDWPDVVVSAYSSLSKMVQNDIAWDLTDYIPQYVPWLEKRYPKDSAFASVYDDPVQVTGGQEGRIFALPNRINASGVYTQVFQDVDLERWSRLVPLKSWEASNNAKIYVRDDLLKAVRPGALTLAELEGIYEQEGAYTREQLFDVSIRSMDDYIQLLRDLKAYIDANDIQEDGKKVMAGMANEGGDTYAFLACLVPSLTGTQGVGYGTYWMKGSTKVGFRLPEMKEPVKKFWQLVQEDVWSKESLIDTFEITRSKVDSGLYATLHVPWMGPNNAALEEAGKSFRYRKLNLEIPFDTDNYFLFQSGPASTSANWTIVKENIDESELIQILRFFNYCLSDTGDRNLMWGPRSAGLWTEADGKRTFVSSELVSDLVNRQDTGLNMKYGLYSGVFPNYWLPFPSAYQNGISLNNPTYVYDEVVRSRSDYEKAYTSAVLKGEGYWMDEIQTIVAMTPDFWNFEADVTVAGTKFTATWNEWNGMINGCLAASSEADFEAKWNAAIQFIEESGGMSPEGLDEITAYFLDRNKDYLDILQGD